MEVLSTIQDKATDLVGQASDAIDAVKTNPQVVAAYEAAYPIASKFTSDEWAVFVITFLPLFFVSIEIEPSNIAKNETTQIRTRAKDLDDGEAALNYSFRALDDIYGTVTPCPNASEYCTTEYLSSDQDTNGLKEFEVDVSDGQVTDTVKGGFNIRAFGGIDLIINFNFDVFIIKELRRYIRAICINSFCRFCKKNFFNLVTDLRGGLISRDHIQKIVHI